MNIDEWTPDKSYKRRNRKYEKIKIVVVCLSAFVGYVFAGIYPPTPVWQDYFICTIFTPLGVYFAFKIWEWIDKS